MLSSIVKVYIDSDMASIALSSLKTFLPEIEFHESKEKNADIAFKRGTNISPHDEYYEIIVADNKVTVAYVDSLGARNAASTIALLLEKNEIGYSLPKGKISDYPDFSFRSGLLETSGRAWMDLDLIKDYIVLMALSKMNYMHFHFMEHMGCSVQLDSIGRVAGYGNNNRKNTKEEIRDLISFAASLGVEIIPGIELPAHSQAILASYSNLRCTTQAGVKTSSWVSCAGSEATYELYENLLMEVADLFPSKYIHIGADELDFGEGSGWEPAWLDCSKCKDLCDKEGISTEREIFYYFINRIYGVSKKLDKTLIMFNDQIDISVSPDIPKDIIIHFWRIASPGRGPYEGCSFERFLEEGYTLINSYYPETYVDFEEYASSNSINKWSPSAVPESKNIYKNQIIGGEFCAWEKHPHFRYTIPSAAVLYGDRLWNSNIREYNEEYGQKMTRLIQGVDTPKGFNIFKYLGDVFPPRDDINKAYLDKVDAGIEELEEAIEILRAFVDKGEYMSSIASTYIECLEWVIDNI